MKSVQNKFFQSTKPHSSTQKLKKISLSVSHITYFSVTIVHMNFKMTDILHHFRTNYFDLWYKIHYTFKNTNINGTILICHTIIRYFSKSFDILSTRRIKKITAAFILTATRLIVLPWYLSMFQVILINVTMHTGRSCHILIIIIFMTTIYLDRRQTFHGGVWQNATLQMMILSSATRDCRTIETCQRGTMWFPAQENASQKVARLLPKVPADKTVQEKVDGEIALRQIWCHILHVKHAINGDQIFSVIRILVLIIQHLTYRQENSDNVIGGIHGQKNQWNDQQGSCHIVIFGYRSTAVIFQKHLLICGCYWRLFRCDIRCWSRSIDIA